MASNNKNKLFEIFYYFQGELTPIGELCDDFKLLSRLMIINIKHLRLAIWNLYLNFNILYILFNSIIWLGNILEKVWLKRIFNNVAFKCFHITKKLKKFNLKLQQRIWINEMFLTRSILISKLPVQEKL